MKTSSPTTTSNMKMFIAIVTNEMMGDTVESEYTCKTIIGKVW